MPRIPRPLPVGINPRGLPVWDGRDLALFRIAHGIGVNQLAVQMSVSGPAISSLYESTRAPLSHHYDRIEKYLAAVLAVHERREAKADEARRKLVARIAARSETFIARDGRGPVSRRDADESAKPVRVRRSGRKPPESGSSAVSDRSAVER